MKKTFVVKLIPPRKTFSQDMSVEERNIMIKHVEYWNGLKNKGIVLLFGPVLDPNGTYGLGIIEADNIEEVVEYIKYDPAIIINKFEYYEFLAVK